MKKLSLILLVAIFIQVDVFAAVVRGRVVDDQKEPLGYVNAALISSSDKSLIFGAVTNEQGEFVISNVPVGKYSLEVSFIGYKTTQKIVEIKSASDEIKTGQVVLHEDAAVLDAVEVVGQASQMRFDIDKKVFNVDQNLAASGASASEMLSSIPSVDVDNEGNISLRNDANVEVWINGKPSGLNADNRAEILEQMPAGSIEAVEVITNPSAKYKPEGTAGIINLVLKKDRKMGYYGSVSGGGTYVVGNLPGANLGVNFNFNSKWVDFYVNVGGRYMNMSNNNFTDRYSFRPNTNRLDTLAFLNNNSDGKRTFMGAFMRAGLDIHLNKKNTLSFSGMGNPGMFHGNTTNSYTQVNWASMDTTLYNKHNLNDGTRFSYSGAIDYVYEIDKKGSDLRIGAEYSTHMRDVDYDYEQNSILGNTREYIQKQHLSGHFQKVEFRADYTQKFMDNMKLEAGLYGEWKEHNSPTRTWDMQSNNEPKLSQYNDFIHDEYIAAAYATYGAKFGGFSFSAGLRGEYANVQVQTRDSENENFELNKKSYWQLYPTAFLSYAFPNNHELQANYTRRINRPWGRQINAFRNVSDSTNISFGNPLLDPEISSSAELNYIKTWDNHAITASLFYRYSDNVIQQVRYLGADDVMYTTYENIARNQSAGAELVAKNRVAKWLNLTSTLSGYYSSMNDVYYDTNLDGVADLLYAKQQSFSWNARMMANFIIPMGFSAQLTASYNSPRVVAQGKTKAQYTIDLGVKKSFLDRKLNLSLSVRDLLNSRWWSTTTWGDNFWQYAEHEPHGTMISLSLSYNFGNQKAKKKPQRNFSSDEGDSMEF